MKILKTASIFTAGFVLGELITSYRTTRTPMTLAEFGKSQLQGIGEAYKAGVKIGENPHREDAKSDLRNLMFPHRK